MLGSLQKVLTGGVVARNFKAISGGRWFSSASDVFEKAQEDLKKLNEEPDVETKLKLYALFKQATVGDPTGTRPGVMDFAGRAKFDAWNKLKGTTQDSAKSQYASLVSSLLGTEVEEAAKTSSGGEVLGLKPVPGIDLSIEDKVFKITLNRPKKYNAIDWPMYEQICHALNTASKDRTTTVTVMTGVGKYYSAGNDLTQFVKLATASDAEKRKYAEDTAKGLKEYVDAFIYHEKPLVTLVNGPAVGIAVTVLPLSDLVLASDMATFNTPFAAIGQSPEGCSSFTFPQLMGQLHATEVLLMGKKLTAAEAFERKLVNQVFPDSEFAASTAKMVAELSRFPPETTRIIKKILRDPYKKQLSEINQLESQTIRECWLSKECAQAIANFMRRSKK